MGLYLFICMVLMVNLLIALLSATYSRLSSQATGLYLKIIIEEHPRWACDPRFNLFSFRVPPLNILTLLALPCFSRFSAKTKDCLEKCLYLPAYFMALGLISGVNILSFP